MGGVYLSIGHGTRPNGTFDTGAQGPSGTTEAEWAAKVVREIERLADQSGLPGTIERGERSPNFSGSIQRERAGSYDCCVEVHFDWSGAPRGGFGFHISSGGRELSDRIRRAYSSAGLPLRSDMRNLPGTSSPPAWVRRTASPAVLWECDTLALTRAQLDALVPTYARAIHDGIAAFLGYEPAGAHDLGDRVLERGSRGDDVREWQELLVDWRGARQPDDGHDPIQVDGVFGPRTAWESSRALLDSGLDPADRSAPRVGPRSIEALTARLNELAQTTRPRTRRSATMLIYARRGSPDLDAARWALDADQAQGAVTSSLEEAEAQRDEGAPLILVGGPAVEDVLGREERKAGTRTFDGGAVIAVAGEDAIQTGNRLIALARDGWTA